MKKLILLFGTMFCLGILLSFGQKEDKAMVEANNPLADFTGLAFQNYYSNNLEGLPDQSLNSLQLRLFKPIGKFLIRGTLPFNTYPGDGVKSGIGDLSIFATYTFLSKPGLVMGAGPMLIMPTASEDILGVDPWQLGAAFIVFNMKSKIIQYGFLTTYQHTVWKDDSEMDSDILTFQPYNIFQLGKGTYLRSTAVMTFSPENGTYNVPFGIGVGQVIKVGTTMFNLYLEPQYVVLHHSVGQPQYQIQAGINLLFKNK